MSVTPVSQVQAQLNAFLNIPEALRPPIFWFPNGYIACNTALVIPPNVRNVRFVGGPNTVFIRTTNNVNFQFIQVGSTATIGLSNTDCFRWQTVQLEPLLRGQTTFTPVSGTPITPGWYFLFGASDSPIGTNPDVARNSNGSTTYWYRRELVFVNAGTPQRFTDPVARDYSRPFLTRMDGSVGSPSNGLCENISFENFTMDGYFQGALPARFSLPRNTYPTRLMTVRQTVGLTMKNVIGRNFTMSGIRLDVVRNFLVEDVQINDAVGTGLRYGLELSACRGGEIKRLVANNVRLAITTGAGTSHIVVRDSKFSIETAVDLCHGQGEEEITYINVLAGIFQIGNVSWTAGGRGFRMINCSALNVIEVKPNAQNVQIVGNFVDATTTPPTVYPTAPRVAFFSNGSSLSIPSGPVGPGDTVIEDATFEMNLSNQVPPIPSAGFVFIHYGGGASPLPRVGNLTVRNSIFKNLLPIQQSSSAAVLGPWVAGTGATPPQMIFERSSFFNINGFVPVANWNASTDGTPFDLRFTDCAFYTNDPGGLAISRALRFGPGSTGNVTLQRVTFNKVTRAWTLDGSPTDNAVLNEGNVTLTYLP